MRYAILGAGAVGGVIGGLLHAAGREVALVARGAHLAAIRARGLSLETPERAYQLEIPAFASVEEISPAPDIALLAVKSQDTEGALERLPRGLAILCAQNGVANERAALRRFDRVYGAMVWTPAWHLVPGEVGTASVPAGRVDPGLATGGIDPLAEEVAADLRAAGFLSTPRGDIMAWKYSKLLTNLGNAVQALCGAGRSPPEVLAALAAEGTAVLVAAGIEFIPVETLAATTAEVVARSPRIGGSTLQSLARAAGSVEVDWLNGEISLLGRLHGVPTPINGRLQAIASEHAAARLPPGTWTPEELASALGLAG